MNTYQTIIESCKDGEEKGFLILTEKFMPLIKKYTRLLYKDEVEDVKQEMLMALWEASQKIEKYDNEGECTKYFSNALRCRFLELYRKSRKTNDNAIDVDESVMESEKSDDHMNYSYVNLRQDIMFLIEDFSTPVKEMCIKMAFEDLSDAEIAKKFNVSRQYTNRISISRVKTCLVNPCHFYFIKNFYRSFNKIFVFTVISTATKSVISPGPERIIIFYSSHSEGATCNIFGIDMI